MNTLQQKKARQFADLHKSPRMLVLPNAWDVPSAKIFENSGFPAVATTSAGMFVSLGFPDGEEIGRRRFLSAVKIISSVLTVPLSVDAVAGFGKNLKELKLTIKGIIEAGAVGLNIEDFEHETGKLFPLETQLEKIRVIKDVGEEVGVDLFINARTDALRFFKGSDEEKFMEALERSKKFRDAGAGCVYPMGLVKREDIEKFVREMNGFPINVMIRNTTPTLREMEHLGVKRASFGPGAIYSAMGLLRRISSEVLNEGKTEALTKDAITYDELVALTRKTND
ncbi:MAG: carboxyphosphonoenolpyruvate phosphonomutase [Thermoplasmatales archaeon I-plasma]|nr:MAG: carboxyphosphonoenolpyruvate phosphonomutase [Thermoplasmatales archaeon I-plasma]